MNKSNQYLTNHSKSVYLDNNANTEIPQYILNEMMRWYNIGNPGADTDKGNKAKIIIKKLKQEINKSINTGSMINHSFGQLYDVIITSGASESNSTIIKSAVKSAYINRSKRNQYNGVVKPHIITSSFEHKSILYILEDLEQSGEIDVTYINPDITGHISVNNIEENIRPETCLISIMGANNETGAINNIKEISMMCNRYGIHFHSDIVQLFGKYPIIPNTVDSFSISFHKLHGPIGVGVLGIKQRNCKVCPLVYGTQNDNMRGGTENIVGIVGSYYGLLHNKKNRNMKNKYMIGLKKYLINQLNNICPSIYLDDYLYEKLKDSNFTNCIVILSPKMNCLPNTLLVSFKLTGDLEYLCNNKLKSLLRQNGITVSVGSACNTSNTKASHVLDAIGVPNELKKGVIRISMGDETTLDDIKYFIKVIKKIIFRN